MTELQRIFFEAIDVDPSERSAFLDAACGDDLNTRLQVEDLLRQLELAGDFLEDPFVSPAVPQAAGDADGGDRAQTDTARGVGDSGTDGLQEAAKAFPPKTSILPSTTPHVPGYDVLEQIGQGGMGVVYRARQISAKRVVALKTICPAGQEGDEFLARFQREAEAAARLRHPGIVQIFEVGQHDGTPFFTMEYCAEGDLARFLAGTPLPPEAAARLVADLSDAVQAAHDANIVHRDLKPANVLFTRRSTTESSSAESNDAAATLSDYVAKLSDFGAAKQLDNVTLTRGDLILGTPSHMSPEQASGKGQVGPATDIYSLGSILYECLTGRPPFKAATPLQTLLQVTRDEPAPPRQLQSNIPKDLNTICLKCLAKDPARRYGSARDLAEDLRRFLQGHVILARRAGSVERGIRWCRRNPTVASLLVSVALLLIAGTTTSLYFAIRADRNATNAKLVAAAEAEARRDAEANEREAREKHLLAVRLLTQQVFTVHDHLRHVPGAGPARRALLKQAFEGLEQVSDRLETADATDRTTMTALRELGEVYLIAGGAGTENEEAPWRDQAPSELASATGETTAMTRKALHFFERSLAIAQRLYEADQQNPRAIEDLVFAMEKIGQSYVQLGDTSKAREQYEASLAVLRQPYDNKPMPQLLRLESGILHRLAMVQSLLGRQEDALKTHQEGLELAREMTRLLPEDGNALRAYSVSLYFVGDANRKLSNLEAAERHYRQAFEITERFAALMPDEALPQEDMQVALQRLGMMHYDRHEYDEALRIFKQSHALARARASAGPHDRWAQRNYQVALRKLGSTYVHLGDHSAALKHFQESRLVAETLVATDPEDAEVREHLATILRDIGDVYVRTKDHERAVDCYTKSCDIRRKLVAADAVNIDVRRQLVLALEALGDLQSRSGAVREAAKCYQEGYDLHRELAPTDPQYAERRRNQAVMLLKLSQSYMQSGELKPAIQYGQEAKHLFTAMAAGHLDDGSAKRDMGVAAMFLGDTFVQAGEPASALEQYGEAEELFQARVSGGATDDTSRNDVCAVLEKTRNVYVNTNRFHEALDYQKKIVAAERVLLDAQSQNVGLRQRVANSLGTLSDLQLHQGEPDDARRSSLERLSICEKLNEDHPTNQGKAQIALIQFRLGTVAAAQFDYPLATTRFEKALEIMRELEPTGALESVLQGRETYGSLPGRIAFCQMAANSLADLNFVLDLPSEQSFKFLAIRMKVLAKRGQHREASETAEKLVDWKPATSKSLYHAACGLALCVEAVRQNPPGNEDGPPNAELVEQYGRKAVEVLMRAKQEDLEDLKRLRTDGDLNPIRNRDDFQQLLREAEASAAQPESRRERSD